METIDQRPATPMALTIAEAAGFVGRSQTWVRQQREFGMLEPVEVNGRQAVTTRSLLALKQRSQPGPILRLVVDNTSK